MLDVEIEIGVEVEVGVAGKVGVGVDRVDRSDRVDGVDGVDGVDDVGDVACINSSSRVCGICTDGSIAKIDMGVWADVGVNGVSDVVIRTQTEKIDVK